MNWSMGRRLAVLAVAASCAIAADSQQERAVPDRGIDLSKAVVDTTIKRLPTAADLGPWEYSRALFLLGEFSVYERTHDPRYLAYAKAWVDSHVDANGNIDRPVDALDFIMPGNLLLALYEQTGEKKYELAAAHLEALFAAYPRTSDGAFWHAEGGGREHQLWLDGTYMGLPFMIRQGELSGQPVAFENEAARQLLLYDQHLRKNGGRLFYHAYDETATAAWVVPGTRHSAVEWCRSIGWYGMALVDILDVLPVNHPDRPKLIAILRKLVADLAFYQDKRTGLWFQVIDQPELKGNWLETSGSSMFTYTIDRAVKRGYIAKRYAAVARKGYEGVLSRVSEDSDGNIQIRDIAEGTNVSNLQYYLDRKRYTNDFHGLGAFLLMNEEVEFNRSATDIVGIQRRQVAEPGRRRSSRVKHASLAR